MLGFRVLGGLVLLGFRGFLWFKLVLGFCFSSRFRVFRV